jgi:hypothetical protein
MQMRVMWPEIWRKYLYYFLLRKHSGINNILLHLLSTIETSLHLTSKIDSNVFKYLSWQEIDILLSIFLQR